MISSIAHQSIAELGGPTSLLVRQRRDHIRLDRLLDRLDRAPLEDQDRILLSVHRLVFPHAFAEETLLWPVIREILADGETLTLQVEVEHQEINELAVRLEELEPLSPDRPRVLARMIKLLRQDVRDEEDILLPGLQEKLSPGRLRWLGLAWEILRRISPTRPHPVVSRRPPGNLLSALPLSIVDRLRDGADALIHHAPAPVPSLLRPLSAVLRETSHAVERFPGFRAGEREVTRRGGLHGAGWAAALLAVGGASLALAARRR